MSEHFISHIISFIEYATKAESILPIIGCIFGIFCGAVIGHYQVYRRMNKHNTLASDFNPEYKRKNR